VIYTYYSTNDNYTVRYLYT